MPPKNWDDTTDRQLLLIMIHLAAPQLPKWDKVAELMGDRFTAEAVRQHFQKLRKASVTQFGALGGSNSNTSTPAPTPRKPKDKGNNQTSSKSAGKRKNMSSATFGVDGDDDDDEEASPLKKQAVKIEKVEDLDDGAFN